MILSLLAGCGNSGPADFSAPLPRDATALALDDPSSFGFTPRELAAQTVATFAAVQVAWQDAPVPATDRFAFSWGDPGEAREVTVFGVEPCEDLHFVEVDLPVHVTSDDGEIEAHGTLSARGIDLTSDQIFLDGLLETTVTGLHASEMAAGFDRVEAFNLSGALVPCDAQVAQRWTLGVEAWDGTMSHNRAHYRCWEAFGGDCFVPEP